MEKNIPIFTTNAVGTNIKEHCKKLTSINVSNKFHVVYNQGHIILRTFYA